MLLLARPGGFWSFKKSVITKTWVLPVESFLLAKWSGSCKISRFFQNRYEIMSTVKTENQTPLVGVIMGSKSDWPTMKNAVDMLEQFGVPYEVKVVSAHRTPDLMFEYAQTAEARGLQVIIAGAGGAAHLPGMVAAKTIVPVLGVPVQSRALSGEDSLLSIVQMPGGIPVGTLAIGDAGAKNAGILASQMVGTHTPAVREAVRAFREAQTQFVLDNPDPRD
jgi:5-(carboxyamino)imidazole ribonucleotide mutase